MSDDLQVQIQELLDTWWRAQAAWLALDEFVLTRLDVPDVIREAAEALFAIEISAAVRLREMGLTISEPGEEELATAQKYIELEGNQ